MEQRAEDTVVLVAQDFAHLQVSVKHRASCLPGLKQLCFDFTFSQFDPPASCYCTDSPPAIFIADTIGIGQFRAADCCQSVSAHREPTNAMATQELDMSEPSDRTQPHEESDEQYKSADSSPQVDAGAHANGHALRLTPGLPTDASNLPGQLQDGSRSDADRDPSIEDASSAIKHDNSQADRGAQTAPSSKLTTPLVGGDTASPPGFTFSKLDRRTLDFGGKRKALHQNARRDDSSPPRTRPAKEDAQDVQDTNALTTTPTSPLVSTTSINHAHRRPSEAMPHGSDIAAGSYSEPVRSQSSESVQHQLDQQIYHEASLSDEIERTSSPTNHSEDVVYIGANPSRYPGHATSDPTSVEARAQMQEPLHYLLQEANKMSQTASSNSKARQEASRMSAAPTAVCKLPTELTTRRPIPKPAFQATGNASDRTPTQGGIQELLEVVEYKFKQNEQRLRQAFFADSTKVQRELKQAYEENEDLQSRVATLEDRCTSSEATIVKYRTQIGKAKGLQRFLDGLGSDLQSLKRSFDSEKSVFAERIEASETEISRLESTLAGKNEFESMLSHSKTSLEKLLEARNFELQSLVQHRDMLRIQLDERIGQLVEERDARSRLEQLVGELRVNERTSLTTSIEQCAASLGSRFADFCRQDDQLVVGIAELQDAIKTLTERPSVTSADCEAIKTEIRVLGTSIVQSMSVEAATSTTVADVSASVEGVVQTHIQMLCRGLDRLESVSKQTSGDASAQTSLRLELQGVADRLQRAETQLESEKQNKANLEKSLDQSVRRVAELEAASTAAAGRDTDLITRQSVENKVYFMQISLLPRWSLMRT
jgi:hypothetical protein